MSIVPFVGGAKMQTMMRDFDRLRKSIRAHDSFEAELAWEKCERWLGAVSVDIDQAHINHKDTIE